MHGTGEPLRTLNRSISVNVGQIFVANLSLRHYKALTACYRSHDQKRFDSPRNCVRQGGVRWFMGQILLAGEEPHKRSALLRDVVANRAAQHWVATLERIQYRALSNLSLHLKADLAVDVCQRPQMYGNYDSDHGSVWTSTDNTAGRSRTIGAQLSPASADAYTCPPVVPKYTPHESSESTAMASRSTLT